VLSINKNEPNEDFATSFLADSLRFLENASAYRAEKEGDEKLATRIAS
jgi:hypothetical protein